ncbi:MAG: AEC family transporter [Dehalococcoidales bacterium]|nr:MAG: AEC family transporter [Dehalococcoidales bacterium]
MTDLLNVVLPTFIIIFVGFLFGKIKKWDLSVISEIVIYIGLPALVLTSMLEKKIVLLNAAKVWGSAAIIIFGCLVVAWIVFKTIKQRHSGLYLPISIMNAVNIPFPIIYLTYGQEGLYAATLFMIASGVITYTVGIYIASGKDWRGALKEVLKIPPIYAAVLGLILNMLEVDVPELITTPLNIIGLMAVPLVLLVLGNNLSKIKITSVPTTLLASFLRIGVGLGFGFLAVTIFDLTGVLRAVVILNSAMPAAVNAAIIATKYDSESDLVSSVIFVTTVASLAVIPFILHFLT